MKKITIILLVAASCLILSAPAQSKNFERVDLHNGILKKTNFVPKADWPNTKQSGGTGFAEAAVLRGGNAGSSQLLLRSSQGFGAGQLITYEGRNRQYYTAVIARMNGKSIRLAAPLEVTISGPQKIRNFYADPDHPNEYGYNAIADSALRNLRNLNKGKHVLLGDSWFDHYPRHLSNRLAKRLPNATIINVGKGGNTTQDLLNRFDAAVTRKKPDTVWIMVGTNDYNQYVSKATYSRNMQQIIRRIKRLGARAIIFNSSVGKPITHSKAGKRHPRPLNTKKVLSHDYYTALESMLRY